MERYSSFYPFSIRFLPCWFLSRAISVRLKRETAIPQGASNICIHFNISMWALFMWILSWRFVNINDGAERWACLYTYRLKTNPFVIWFEQPLYCKRIREVRLCSYGFPKVDVVHIFAIRTDSSHSKFHDGEAFWIFFENILLKQIKLSSATGSMHIQDVFNGSFST